MAFTSNIAAINAANAMLKAVYSADALQGPKLKEARNLHFAIEKHDGEWHSLIICPLPAATQISPDGSTADAGASDEQAPEQAAADQEPEAPSNEAGQAAFANAAAQLGASGQQSAEVQTLINDAAQASEQFGDDTCEEFAEAQRAADAQANVQQATSELKNGKVWIHVSSCESPVKRVWAIADAMRQAALDAGKPQPSRKEVQDECVRMGVASGTARTQYQAWKKANDNDAANAANAAALSAALNSRSKL